MKINSFKQSIEFLYTYVIGKRFLSKKAKKTAGGKLLGVGSQLIIT